MSCVLYENTADSYLSKKRSDLNALLQLEQCCEVDEEDDQDNDENIFSKK